MKIKIETMNFVTTIRNVRCYWYDDAKAFCSSIHTENKMRKPGAFTSALNIFLLLLRIAVTTSVTGDYIGCECAEVFVVRSVDAQTSIPSLAATEPTALSIDLSKNTYCPNMVKLSLKIPLSPNTNI